MSLRCLLVPSHTAEDATLCWNAALSLSHRLRAHIRTVFIRSDPKVIFRNLPDVIRIGGVTAAQIENEGKAEAARSRAAFEGWCAAVGLCGATQVEDLQTPFGTWTEQIGEIEPIVGMTGRVSDIILVNRPNDEDMAAGRILDVSLFSTGRPTLMVGDQVPDDLLRHVVIAWNGSLEAARLIGHAITLLHQSDRVSIVTVPTERSSETAAADLQDYLVWHGIRAHQLSTVSGAESVGEALLETATRFDASLLMMGAYTHSRIRQMFLGGVTRHILHNAEIPVLMEH